MSLFAATLHALAPLFLLIVLGYVLKRMRILHVSQVPVMNGLVLNVTMPALIVRGLIAAPAMPASTAWLPVLIIGSEIATIALAYGIGRALRLPQRTMGALLLVSAFGNTGFLGYPMTLALLPHQFPAAILIDQFGMTVPLYLSVVFVGAAFGTGKSVPGTRRTAVGKFLRSPLFLSLVVGSVCREIPWPMDLFRTEPIRTLGDAVSSSLYYLGQGTTPIVLLALGAALSPGTARANAVPLMVSSAMKLVAAPAVVWLLCHLVHIRGEQLAVVVFLAAMPTSVMASVFAAHHDLDGDYAVGTVFITTLLAAVTVPFWLSIVR